MKKSILLILLSVAITASAVTVFITRKSKVPIVSENVNIPDFIDTFMLHEKNRLYTLASDSNSENSRLTKLGFTAKSGNVFDYYTAKAVYNLYEVYDSIYPSHQFINFKGVSELMKKYGLVFGSTASFICDIPKEKVDSIESFKSSYIFDRASNYPLHDLNHSMEELANNGNGYGSLGGYINDTYARITKGLGKLGDEKNLAKYSVLDMVKRPQGTTTFFMIAPPHCFTGEVNEKGNYGGIKDPIVLAPVEGGYIIVTAW